MRQFLHVLQNSTVSIGRVKGEGFGIFVVAVIVILGMIILPRYVTALLPFF